MATRPATGIRASSVVEEYLIPSVGYASSPDNAAFIAPLDMTVTGKVKFNGPFTATGIIFGQWGTAAGDGAWMLYTTATGTLRFQLRDPAVASHFQDVLSFAELSALVTTDPVYIGAKVQGNVAGVSRFVTLRSFDKGATWAEFGTAKSGTAAYTGSLNSTTQLGVGRRGNTGADIFPGTVYNFQARSGTNPNAGTFLARFDAREYPGDVLSWTDPRGLGWNVSSTSAIT